MSREEGQRLADQLGAPFFETSAVLRQCVDESFHGLVREIRRKEHEKLVAEDKLKRKQQRRKRVQTFLNRLNFFKKRSSTDSEDTS